jgi:DNA-binding XRE family transcriptional regulator
MTREQFAKIRRYLKKTQKEMSQSLSVSPKTIESYEGGQRNIPISIQKQLLLLLALKQMATINHIPQCWEIRDCPTNWRNNCDAWEYQAGHLCWLINGTYCDGKYQENWAKKIVICRQCEIMKELINI